MNPRNLENTFIDKVLTPAGFLSQKALFSVKRLPDGRTISNRSDFFGSWDIISIKDNKVFMFQVCTGTTYAEHVRTIEKRFPFTSNPIQVIVYYFKEKNRWKFTLHVRSLIGWQEVKPDVLLNPINSNVSLK